MKKYKAIVYTPIWGQVRQTVVIEADSIEDANELIETGCYETDVYEDATGGLSTTDCDTTIELWEDLPTGCKEEIEEISEIK